MCNVFLSAVSCERISRNLALTARVQTAEQRVGNASGSAKNSHRPDNWCGDLVDASLRFKHHSLDEEAQSWGEGRGG